jgi:hypothetical protein
MNVGMRLSFEQAKRPAEAKPVRAPAVDDSCERLKKAALVQD